MKVLKFSGKLRLGFMLVWVSPTVRALQSPAKGHLNSARPTMAPDEPDGMWKGMIPL